MRKLRFVTVPVVGCLALAGCSASTGHGAGGGGGGPVTYAKDGTFVLNTGIDDPGAFDPYHNQFIRAISTLSYDSLLKWQPDGTFASGVAAKWKSDVHGATFTLQKGVTCSDGSSLTASQVARDLKYLADPKNGSPEYGVTIPPVPFSVTADDSARTVTVKMSKPYGFVLNTIGLAPIMCEDGVKHPASLKNTSSGTGPFKLVEHQPGQSMTFVRRKGYTWGPDGASTSAPGTPAKIVLKFVTDQTTAANLLLAGKLNATPGTGQQRKRLDARGLQKVEAATTGQWIWFNQIGKRSTQSLDVRKALTTALDIPQLIKVSTGGFGKAAPGLIMQRPTVCPGSPLKGMLPKHDPAAAASLLDRAGWVKGNDGVRRKAGKTLRLDIHYAPSISAYGAATAELMAKEWQAVGVTTKLTADSPTALTKTMFQDSDWDVYLEPFGGNLPSQMIPYLSGPTPPNGVNLAGVDNATYNQLTVKAQKLAPPKACASWDKAEKALYRNLDVVPISAMSLPLYLNKAQAQSNGFHYIPTSFKVLK